MDSGNSLEDMTGIRLPEDTEANVMYDIVTGRRAKYGRKEVVGMELDEGVEAQKRGKIKAVESRRCSSMGGIYNVHGGHITLLSLEPRGFWTKQQKTGK